MTMTRFVGGAACLLMGGLTLGVMAQANETPVTVTTHPIELETDSCMESGNWTTQAMRDCASEAQSAWNEEIERLASVLERVLGGEAVEALEQAQAAWRTSRDADFELIGAYHAELYRAELGGGTLGPLSEQLHRNAVLRDRALQLQRYLDALEELNPPEEVAD